MDTQTADDPAPAPAPSTENLPPYLKTTTWTRADKEKKSCPSDWGLFSPTPWGPGKKKLCLISRSQYRLDLKSPVYYCNPGTGFNPNGQNGPEYGTCRSDPFNGTAGKIRIF